MQIENTSGKLIAGNLLEHLPALSYEEKQHFAMLFKSASPCALFTDTPSYEVFNLENKFFTVVNYSNVKLSIGPDNYLMVAGRKAVQIYNLHKCYLLAYQVPEYPQGICVEEKSAKEFLPGNRILIKPQQSDIPDMGERGSIAYRFYQLPCEELVMKERVALFGIHPAERLNFKQLVQADESLARLFRALPKQIIAPFTTNEAVQFRVRNTYLTLVNNTKHKLTFDVLRCLNINDKCIKQTFSRVNCQLIAYQLMFDDTHILIEHKAADESNLKPRLCYRVKTSKSYWQLGLSEKRIKAVLRRASSRVRAFTVWKASYDAASLLSRENMPIEILGLILKQYLSLSKKAPNTRRPELS